MRAAEGVETIKPELRKACRGPRFVRICIRAERSWRNPF